MSAARRARLLALWLATACDTHMNVTLILPEQPPLEIDSYSVALVWDGGHWDGSVPFADGGVQISPPKPSGSFDLVVLGILDGGVSWRGLARGVSPDDAQPSLFFGKVGAFSSFLQMPSGVPALAGSSASPVGSGQVLMAGGQNDAGMTDQAWLFDLPTASFLPAHALLRPMSHHLALPLLLIDPAGGMEWLLAGGDDPDGGFATAQAQLYSTNYDGQGVRNLPQAQRAPSGSWVDPLGTSAAVGCGLAPGGDAALFQFTPETLGFHTLLDGGSCNGGQLNFLGDAGIAVIGLGGEVVLLATLDGGPRPLASLAVTSGFRSAVFDGGITILGGVSTSGTITNGVQQVRLDSDAGNTGTLLAARADFAVLLLDGGQLLVVGGRGVDGGALASAQLLDLQTLTSTVLPPMAHARINPALSDIPGYGAALVISGEDEAGQPAGGFEVFTYR